MENATQPVDPSTISSSIKKLPFSFAKRHNVIAQECDKAVTVTYTSKTSTATLQELRRFFNKPLHLELTNDNYFSQLLTKHYEVGSTEAFQMVETLDSHLDLQQLIQDLPKTEDLLENQDDAPIIRILNALLSEAIKLSASDIHIETYEDKLTVRFRIDGVLRKILEPQRVLASLIVSRIKVMAKLDIAEKRLPQDGRMTVRIAGWPIDIRVSTLPSSHGERIVLRLLDKKVARLNLADLGMSDVSLSLVKQMIAKPHGIILVTGPTGSGKTTTLYAILSDLNNPSRNILTVEDPIEYDLPGIGQTQVNTKVDLSFARGLRAILRQDPDVVMVGEIRDLETAQIAVQASLTGHLVLSTLHTNSAVGAVTRLRDMGIESYLLASSLIGVIAQRLVRVLCPNCKAPKPASHNECETLGLDPNNPIALYYPNGCEQCGNTGYSGRTGIYDLVLIDDKIRTFIHGHASEQEMESHARLISPSMRQCGYQRVIAGETTLEEVIRVSLED